MKRMDVDRAAIDTGSLQDAEQLVTVRFEVLLGVPDLEHLHLVIAVGGVESAPIGVACALGLEVPDHAVVVVPRHVLRGDVDGDGHVGDGSERSTGLITQSG